MLRTPARTSQGKFPAQGRGAARLHGSSSWSRFWDLQPWDPSRPQPEHSEAWPPQMCHPSLPQPERPRCAADKGSYHGDDPLRDGLPGGNRGTSDGETVPPWPRTPGRLQESRRQGNELLAHDNEVDGGFNHELLLPHYRNVRNKVPDSLAQHVIVVPDSESPDSLYQEVVFVVPNSQSPESFDQVTVVPESQSPKCREKRQYDDENEDYKPLTAEQVSALYEECNGNIEKFMLGVVMPKYYSPRAARKGL